jgi:hypothetical protein
MKLKITETRTRQPRRRLEAELEQQCTDFLALDGWRSLKTDPPQLRGLGVIEKGIPDRLYIRYHEMPHREIDPLADVLWIEFKAPSGRVSQAQSDWHMAERARGALVWVARENFGASCEEFIAFYRASGLLRRKGL